MPSRADADDVRRLALALPHVVEIDSEGFDFRLAGKGFVWSYPERKPGKSQHKYAGLPYLINRALWEPLTGAICQRLAAISGDILWHKNAVQRNIDIARRGTTDTVAFYGKEKVYGSIPYGGLFNS